MHTVYRVSAFEGLELTSLGQHGLSQKLREFNPLNSPAIQTLARLCAVQVVREYTEAAAIQHGRVAVRRLRRPSQQQRAATDRQQDAGSASRRHDAPRGAHRLHEVRHAHHAQVRVSAATRQPRRSNIAPPPQ